MLAILNFNAGNLRSVSRALNFLQIEHCVTSSLIKIQKAQGLIFPGVGTAGAAMQFLREQNLLGLLQNHLQQNKPFLGICLGLQVLFASSAEGPTKCLGYFPGSVYKLKPRPGICVPQIGWNKVTLRKSTKLLAGIKTETPFYFLNSYFSFTPQRSLIYATTQHGHVIPAVVAQGNIYGVQFHPEKSSQAGLRVLQNFAKIALTQ